MTSVTWGLLGNGALASNRRSRSLGLGAAVRCFNDLAVPGMGGVWFGKQLLLAALGIQLAGSLRSNASPRTNIQTANAVEALACWLAYNQNKWAADERLKGRNKLRAQTVPSFKDCSKPGFYVTQPMRMATVQVLPALRLVDGNDSERFNAYSLNESGEAFIDEACRKQGRYTSDICNHLLNWARGETINSGRASGILRNVISTCTQLPWGARELLRERLTTGPHEQARRRYAALNWVEQLRQRNQEDSYGWNDQPNEIDAGHWRDLKQGAAFFQLRDAAQDVLLAVEQQISNAQSPGLSLAQRLPDAVEEALERLRHSAEQFLGAEHDPTPGHLASAFAHECMQHDATTVLTALVNRDGRILRLAGSLVIKGPASSGQVVKPPVDAEQALPGEDEEEARSATALRGAPEWPDQISYRIPNLYWLNLDLQGELDALLTQNNETADAA